ncbi:MAG: nicotinamide-nucleotide adenylyltransferase [Candidatus Micrarchaeia archaeon]
MGRMKTGLFIGRFQPFHNGHMRAIEWILEDCDRLIIVVGSSQRSFEIDNPFTVGERIEMITRVLSSKNLLSRCIVLSVPDIQNNALWVAHVNSLVPRYDVVYTNNPLAMRLFKEAGRKVVSIPFFKRSENEGTRIRDSMLKNGEWKKHVPQEVADFIEEIKAIERLHDISKNDA